VRVEAPSSLRPGTARRSERRRSGARWRKLRTHVLPPLVVLIAVLGLWEAGVFHRILGIEPYYLAHPSSVVPALWEERGEFARQSSITFTEAVAGYVIGGALGFVVAMLLTLSRTVQRGLLPILSSLNSMPILAVAPIMLMYFGSGMSSKIATVSFMTAPVMLVNAFKGLTSLDSSVMELMRSCAAPARTVLRKLRVPASLPYVFAALKINVTLALVGAIVSEFFRGYGGLGIFLMSAVSRYRAADAWAGIMVVALFGIAWYLATEAVERKVLHWHPSQRK
jgi:NitT/TauT family transport system permease protein